MCACCPRTSSTSWERSSSVMYRTTQLRALWTPSPSRGYQVASAAWIYGRSASWYSLARAALTLSASVWLLIDVPSTNSPKTKYFGAAAPADLYGTPVNEMSSHDTVYGNESA